MARTKKESSSPSEKQERKKAQPKASPLLTAEQLERMTTHEIADVLSNVVLLLRRMPDVPCQELVARDEPANTASPTIFPMNPMENTSVSPSTSSPENTSADGQTNAVQNVIAPSSSLQQGLQERIAELMDKKHTVSKLKALADESGIPYPAKVTKEVLAKRIAERQMRGHSEQYAMANL